MYILLFGVILVVVSGILTRKNIVQNSTTKNMDWDQIDQHVPGTGIVPTWVSILNIGGWILAVFGIITFFI